jgi:ABC-type glycerol-3-phosphate transport system substrate-binding protein
MRIRLGAVVLIALAQLAGCGGGGGGGSSSPAPTNHTITLAWAPNHEKGVNSTGGGYQVSISGQPTINVPFVSGPTAPTSTVTTLPMGTYTVTVRAYAALDTQGGSAGSFSAPSQSIIVNVP